MRAEESAVTTILLALTFAAVFAYLMRSTRVHGSLEPSSNALRLHQWDRRMACADLGQHSEARVYMQARGAIAKRRMLAHLRNSQPTASAPAGLLIVMQRIGDGPLTPMRLQVAPLASLRAKPEVQIAVRRPRLLSMAAR